MTEVAADRVGSWCARRWWLALMTNAIGLVDDAALLTMHGSYGRAQALLVLATEELARARFLYGAAEDEWSRSIQSEAWIEVPAEVIEIGSATQPRLQVADRYPAGMTAFWEPDNDNGFRFPYSESEQDGGEIEKQAGFYVDRAGDLITSPMDISEGGLQVFVTLVARAIEMHLAEDRTRQQSARPSEPLDMAEYLHVEIFPRAWPEDFDALMSHQKSWG
jgi:hypothetical protein